MTAWHYALEPLTEAQQRNYATLAWNCSARGCGKSATHCAIYTPTDGASPGAEARHTLLCHGHAAEFAAERDAPINPATP